MAELGEKPLVTQVGYVNRFNEVFMEVKRLIDDGVIGDVVNFSSEMYGATVLKDSKSSWRGSRKTGGGCMYEFASHCIDLVVYLLDRPDSVSGSVLQSIYSSEVEDLVSSTFIYNKGFSGTVMSNWSDDSVQKADEYREDHWDQGQDCCRQACLQALSQAGRPENGFDEGWNTRYITDFAKSVRFYLRGNEFTRQLDYFIDCIEGKSTENVASFAEGLKDGYPHGRDQEDAAGLLRRQMRNRAADPAAEEPKKNSPSGKRLVGDKEGKHA